MRKISRLFKDDIPEILQNPILLFNYEELDPIIENLSPLGVGFEIEKNSTIDKGDFFYLKFYSLELDIKCVCVYSDTDGDVKRIGAYFTDQEDQKIILKYLKPDNQNLS